jgi:hypothetical protein
MSTQVQATLTCEVSYFKDNEGQREYRKTEQAGTPLRSAVLGPWANSFNAVFKTVDSLRPSPVLSSSPIPPALRASQKQERQPAPETFLTADS